MQGNEEYRMSKPFLQMHVPIYLDYLPISHGISFGAHLDLIGLRLDIHFLCFVLSIGKIPIYYFPDGGKHGKSIAVSRSYHEQQVAHRVEAYEKPRR
jgi:hypothetical protein